MVQLTSLILLLCGSGSPALAEDAEECTPACEGKVCGDDGCGELCGVCPAYDQCLAGACAYNGGCTPHDVPGCGGCTCESCTCQFDPYCCSGNWDQMCVTRCETMCGGCGKKATCGDGVCEGGENCQSCSGDCGACPTPCGQVTSIGCCVGDSLVACKDGVLAVTNCVQAGFESCGWAGEEGAYGCGGEGADPAGNYPLECPSAPVDEVVEDVGVPEECQGVGFAGCCISSSVFWCDAGGLHSVNCSQNPAPFETCGWNDLTGYYDCGGQGSDPTGEHYFFCPNLETDIKEDVPVAPTCTKGTLVAVGCQDVTFDGCCGDDGALYFCEKGKLCKLDCPELVAPFDSCGWNDVSGWYDCGGEGPDPSGVLPLVCPPFVVEEDVVVEDTKVEPASCAGIPDSACCVDDLLHWCEGGIVKSFDCAELAADPIFEAYVYCGSNPTSGQADCIKKPDPSPPQCNLDNNDTDPEPAEPVADSPQGDGWSNDGLADGSTGDADTGTNPDGLADLPGGENSPFVIGGDGVIFQPPEEGGSGGGCSCSTERRPETTNSGVWLLLAAALMVAGVLRTRTFLRRDSTNG